jgi:hypothetical protein
MKHFKIIPNTKEKNVGLVKGCEFIFDIAIEPWECLDLIIDPGDSNDNPTEDYTYASMETYEPIND